MTEPEPPRMPDPPLERPRYIAVNWVAFFFLTLIAVTFGIVFGNLIWTFLAARGLSGLAG